MRHHSPTTDTRASVEHGARHQTTGHLMDRCRERERTSQSKHVRDPITTKVQTWYRPMERHNIDWRPSEVERVGADIDSLSDTLIVRATGTVDNEAVRTHAYNLATHKHCDIER
jgi:hypothetical protein